MLKLVLRSFSQPKILYLGLGEMGYNLSGSLSKSFPTKVWNRTYAKAKKHSEEHKTKALRGKDPFKADISDIDLIFSCFPTSAEVNKFVDLLINSQSPKKSNLVWVDNTSGEPEVSKEIALKLEKAGIGFIDAPVSGGRAGAIAGQLAVMVGGPLKYFEVAQPVLQSVSKSLIHVDEKVGSGHAVKGLNNLLYSCHLLLAMKTAQALEKNGINVDKALTTILNSSGASAAMKRVYEYATNDRKINYNFKTALLVKDMEIGLSMHTGDKNDRILPIFNKFKKVYVDGSKSNKKNSDVFDLYSFIEDESK